jgi:hypothetical protein
MAEDALDRCALVGPRPCLARVKRSTPDCLKGSVGSPFCLALHVSGEQRWLAPLLQHERHTAQLLRCCPGWR